MTTEVAEPDFAGSITMFAKPENIFKYNEDDTLDTTSSNPGAMGNYDTSSGEDIHLLVKTPQKKYMTEYIKAFILNVILIADDGTLNYPNVFYIDAFGNRFATSDDLFSSPVRRDYNETVGSGVTLGYIGAVTMDGKSDNHILGLDGCMCPDDLLIRVSSIAHGGGAVGGDGEDCKMYIKSLQMHFVRAIPVSDGTGSTLSALEASGIKDMETLTEIEQFYCGGNGQKASWSGTPDITLIHEAHRDMLIRYCGVSTSTPTDWSDLNTSKNDWKIRWWQHEPIELKKALEKLQYEGGFIFRFSSSGNPQYIHIKDSMAVDETLTKHDLDNITIQPSPFNELLTKMKLDYQRHPAEGGYVVSKEVEAQTERTKWNIATKENEKQVQLDAYIEPSITEYGGSTQASSSSPNDNFFAYYYSIFGDIKLIVSATIVNPKYFELEVGQILAFDDMHPVKAFNTSWSGLKFMITSTARSIGILKFEAREI